MNYRALTLTVVLALTVSLAGCKTLNTFISEKKPGSATETVIGTLPPDHEASKDKPPRDRSKAIPVEADIGASPDQDSSTDKSRRDRRKAILVGAGIGGLSGAAIDSYMDKQERKLRKQLLGSGVSVTRNGDDLILNMPGHITFATGSASLKSSFNEVLNSVILVLNEFDQTLIEAAGYTDSVGSNSSNQTLSYNRSRSVGNYLIDNGITVDRVLMVGHGENRPIADNKTSQGRQLNRRVELTLTPIEVGG